MLMFDYSNFVPSKSKTPASKLGLVLYCESFMYTGKWSVETENETGLDGMVQMMAEFMY